MRLSIYLAREGVRNFGELLQENYRQGATTITPKRGLNFECAAFVKQSRPNTPRWTSLLRSHFELSHLHLTQKSSSFVLVLRVKRRMCAITFGYGFTAIDRTRIEPQFGLKTSLALVDDAKIRTLDSRNIDRLVRQRRTHVSSGSRIWDFGVSPSAEWIQYVSGKTASEELGSSVAGADSLSINCEVSLEDLGDFCGALLKTYESDEAGRRFQPFDRMRPLPNASPEIADLETKLADRIARRSHKKLVIAYPEFVDERLVDHYRIGSGHDSIHMPDVSLKAIYDFLDANPHLEPSADKIWIIGEDADGGAIVAKRPLRDYLVCEVAKDDSLYYLSFGEWHAAARRFVDRIRRQIRELADDTGRLRLPAMLRGEREDDYNERVARSKNWLLLDKKLFPLEGRDRVEVCDLYTSAGELIAVKKMRDSANLSHLFAQAAVSAQLLTADRDYRTRLRKLVEDKWNRRAPDFSNRLFVYAIPTIKSGDLAQEMFLFSQINLLEHVQTIRAAGHRVSLCKVEYPTD